MLFDKNADEKKKLLLGKVLLTTKAYQDAVHTFSNKDFSKLSDGTLDKFSDDDEAALQRVGIDNIISLESMPTWLAETPISSKWISSNPSWFTKFSKAKKNLKEQIETLVNKKKELNTIINKINSLKETTINSHAQETKIRLVTKINNKICKKLNDFIFNYYQNKEAREAFEQIFEKRFGIPLSKLFSLDFEQTTLTTPGFLKNKNVDNAQEILKSLNTSKTQLERKLIQFLNALMIMKPQFLII